MWTVQTLNRGFTHWQLPPPQRVSNAQDKNSQYKVHWNFCTITSSFVSSTCHLPRAFKQLSTKFCTSLLSATTLFFTVFDFTLSTTSNGNSVVFELLSGHSEEERRHNLVFSRAPSSLRKILCLGVFSRYKQRCKVSCLKKSACVSRNWGKRFSWIKKQIVLR